MEQATKAVILARVSSKEQEEGHSLEAQRYRLEQYCEKKKLKIIKAFELTESSTRGDRKDFKQMINFVNLHGASPVEVHLLYYNNLAGILTELSHRAAKTPEFVVSLVFS